MALKSGGYAVGSNAYKKAMTERLLKRHEEAKSAGQLNYEAFHRTMHGNVSGPFKSLSPRQKLAWEMAAVESQKQTIERMTLLIQSATHLLMAAHGRDDGPTSWTETRDRWL